MPERRISRATRLGAMAAGVAGNMAAHGLGQLGRGQRPALRDLLMTPANVTRITNELARMRGAAMKLGQMISMDAGELLPPEMAQIMARLRAEADFMPPAQLKQVLGAEWPAGWLKSFQSFNVRPIAAASIGQVHRATLKDGRDLAIKVQYPGVARSIDSDVANVAALVKMTGLLPKGFALDPYVEEARRQLHIETDYLAEGQNLRRYRDLIGKDPAFVLPELMTDWTTQAILAMSYVESAPLDAVAEADQELRDLVAPRMIDLTLRELMRFGLMQTDPNFANFRYVPDTGQIVLLDFGACRPITQNTTALYRRLFSCGLGGDDAKLAQVCADMGAWAAETDPKHKAQLLRMARLVLDAVLGGEVYDFADRSLVQTMRTEGIALAESGFVPPPAPMDILFVQRKLSGVFLIAANLKARVPLRKLIQDHLSGTTSADRPSLP